MSLNWNMENVDKLEDLVRRVSMYVCIIGNPEDGFTIHGTFDSWDQACNYGDRFSTQCLWISKLEMFDESSIEDWTN